MRHRTLDIASFRRANRRAMALCIGLLLIVELGVVRQQWLWTFDERTPVGVMHVLEAEVIGGTEMPPEIIILGNSRMRDALLPLALERELGLDRGEVMNLALTAGTLFDSYLLYRRNRNQLQEASVAILGVEAWYFGAQQRGLDGRFVRHATLADRLSPYVEGRRLDAVIGYFWRTFEAGEQLVILGKALVRGGGRDLVLGPDGRVGLRDEELARGPVDVDVESQVQKIYPGFSPADEPRGPLEELIALLQEDGLEVFIVRPPFRDAFIQAQDARVPQAELWFEDQIHRVQADYGVDAWLPSTASELGWPQDFFLDYGHPSVDGASAFTSEIIDRFQLRTRYPSP